MKIIKCNNCQKEFQGDSWRRIAADNNLIKKGKHYYCGDCKEVIKEGEATTFFKKMRKKNKMKAIPDFPEKNYNFLKGKDD
jgi:hypothetical protein